MEQAKVFTCESCGGIMEFNVEKQCFQCPNCGHEGELNVESPIVREHNYYEIEAKPDESWQRETSVLQCENCGAEIIVAADATSVTCAYCGSSHVLNAKALAGIKPEAIIPFQVDKHKANELFRTWVKKRWFAPGALKRVYQQDQLKPVYLPYWTYDADTFGDYTGYGGRVYYVTVGSGQNKHTERRVQWYPVSGRISHFFDDVLINAKQEPDPLVSKTEAFNTSACVPFSTAYLSGFYAQKYTLSVQDGFQRAQTQMEHTLEQLARQEILSRYDEARVSSLKAKFFNVKFKHVLLPMWMSAYYYAGKLFRYAVNGQTGKVNGEYPKSKVKVAITTVLIIAVVAVLIWLLFFR